MAAAATDKYWWVAVLSLMLWPAAAPAAPVGYENVRVYPNSMNEYSLVGTAPLKLGRAP